MKPLELNVYPLDPTFPRGYKLPRDTRITYLAATRKGINKRLTEAELAAEYWCSEWRTDAPETSREVKEESSRRAVILHRFATTPSYDEVTE